MSTHWVTGHYSLLLLLMMCVARRYREEEEACCCTAQLTCTGTGITTTTTLPCRLQLWLPRYTLVAMVVVCTVYCTPIYRSWRSWSIFRFLRGLDCVQQYKIQLKHLGWWPDVHAVGANHKPKGEKKNPKVVKLIWCRSLYPGRGSSLAPVRKWYQLMAFRPPLRIIIIFYRRGC